MLIFSLAACQSASTLTNQERLARAEKALKEGRYHQALTQLSQIVLQDPHNIQVHVDLAWVYLYSGNPQKASTEIETVLQMDPEHPDLPFLKGMLYKSLEEWVNALDEFNKALETEHVNDPRLHQEIAEVFMALNSPDAAIREYNMASKLDPNNATYEFGRCIAFRKLKDFDKAKQACQLALSLTSSTEEHEQIEEVLQTIGLLQSLDNIHNAAASEAAQIAEETDTPANTEETH